MTPWEWGAVALVGIVVALIAYVRMSKGDPRPGERTEDGWKDRGWF